MAADGVQAVVRAFAVLRAIAAEDGAAGVSAVSRHARLPKSTTARLLTTMEDIGVVERLGGDADYRIGPALRDLAGEGPPGSRLVDVARPYLHDLVEDVDEDAGLAVPAGRDVLFVDQVQSRHPVQVRDWTGERFPMHTTAAGFALLAELPAADVDRFLTGELTAYTAQTLVTAAAIRRRLRSARRAGYTWTVDEWADGISGVGAAITGPHGRAVGAINLYGPSYRFPADRDGAAIGRRVREAADRIAGRLAG